MKEQGAAGEQQTFKKRKWETRATEHRMMYDGSIQALRSIIASGQPIDSEDTEGMLAVMFARILQPHEEWTATHLIGELYDAQMLPPQLLEFGDIESSVSRSLREDASFEIQYTQSSLNLE